MLTPGSNISYHMRNPPAQYGRHCLAGLEKLKSIIKINLNYQVKQKKRKHIKPVHGKTKERK